MAIETWPITMIVPECRNNLSFSVCPVSRHETALHLLFFISHHSFKIDLCGRRQIHSAMLSAVQLRTIQCCFMRAIPCFASTRIDSSVVFPVLLLLIRFAEIAAVSFVICYNVLPILTYFIGLGHLWAHSIHSATLEKRERYPLGLTDSLWPEVDKCSQTCRATRLKLRSSDPGQRIGETELSPKSVMHFTGLVKGEASYGNIMSER